MKILNEDKLIEVIKFFDLFTHDQIIELFFENLYVIPEYYKDTVKNREISAKLENATNVIYVYALYGKYKNDLEYIEKAKKLLLRFSTFNYGWIGTESNLYFVYKGYKLLDAYDLIKEYLNQGEKVLFLMWLNIYQDACNNLKTRINNWGIWSLLGLYHINKIYKLDTNIILEEIKNHIKRATKQWPILSRKNEIWTENLRNNYFQSYTYFYLSVALKIGIFEEEILEIIKPLIQRFYDTVILQDYPKRFPYTLLIFPLGKIQQFLFPAGSDVRIGDRDNWAGNLMKVAGEVYHNDYWKAWAINNKDVGVNLFKYGEIII